MKLFNITLFGFNNKSSYSKNRMIVDVFIKKFDVSGKNPLLSPCPTVNCPYLIADGISEESANNISNFLNQFGCITKIENSKLLEQSKQDDLIKKFFEQDGNLRCPICGSTSVAIGQRGYSLVSGLIGSNQTTNRCGQCGYSWQPHK